MQFFIDTDTESAVGLIMAGEVMALLARAKLAEQGVPTEEIEAAVPRRAPKPAIVPPPVGKPIAPAPAAPLPPTSAPPPPVAHPPVHPDVLPKDVPVGTDTIDPAALFGGNRPAPLAPPPFGSVAAATATAGATSTAPPTLAPVPVPTPAPAVQNAAVTGAENSTPTNPTGTAPAGAVAAERDSEGLPWDARIHSETRKTNADGTWRYRRNLDVGVKATVYAELKAASGVAPPPFGSVSQVANPTFAPPPPVPGDAVILAPPPPPPPPAATVLPFPGPVHTNAAVPLPPAADVGVPNAGHAPVVQTVTSFRDLMQKVNVALAAGRLTQPQLSEACKGAGVDSVTALAAQPMLVPTVDAYLNRWLAA